jgi:hypothetical protein
MKPPFLAVLTLASLTSIALTFDADAAPTQRPKRSSTRPATTPGTKGAQTLSEPRPSPEVTTALPRPQPINIVQNATDLSEPGSTNAPQDGPTVRIAPNPANNVDAQIQGRKLYSFRAADLELKAALALFARANGLNIVPDHDVTGQVTLDVQDLPLERLMQALLEAHDFSWSTEDGLIRVRARESQEYWIDYLRLSRKGMEPAPPRSRPECPAAAAGSGGGGGRIFRRVFRQPHRRQRHQFLDRAQGGTHQAAHPRRP